MFSSDRHTLLSSARLTEPTDRGSLIQKREARRKLVVDIRLPRSWGWSSLRRQTTHWPRAAQMQIKMSFGRTRAERWKKACSPGQPRWVESASLWSAAGWVLAWYPQCLGARRVVLGPSNEKTKSKCHLFIFDFHECILAIRCTNCIMEKLAISDLSCPRANAMLGFHVVATARWKLPKK